LPVSLSSVGVTQAVSVYDKQTNTLYGYAFESVVDGFSGKINFRIGLRLDAFTGFQVVSDNEHSGFGKVILAAFSTSIAGVEVSSAAVLAMLSSKFATRTGKTGTYDGVMPAIDAIIQYMEGL
jgi:Na+-translocating ferredoxin:NAD+ oxidoreductase RnfG subunit